MGKKCRTCGIRVGTPKSAVDEAERERAAGAAAERAAAIGYRVTEAQLAEAVAVDDEHDPAEDVSHARGRG
jgi:hypothetical protein